MNHDHYSEDYLRGILTAVKTIALVGASSNPVRPSYFVLKYMIEKGYDVVPVNPRESVGEILGRPLFASLQEVPHRVDMVDIFRNSSAAESVVDDAIAHGAKVVWMQLGVRNDEAALRAEASGLKVVMNRCPKMEYAKLCGEWSWVGGNPGRISTKRPTLSGNRVQSLSITARKGY
ncbi:hypothetical protein FHS85_004415 [Rhodoligotrophos appendicifer]|uniref:CoA-binding protein n=1 Tax=Rhodoligotrophos appendicifer TaxID=987056 RepID=UPI001186BDBD|nr:CoA-binding protein [Rhodoligotrophos appendicifer]